MTSLQTHQTLYTTYFAFPQGPETVGPKSQIHGCLTLGTRIRIASFFLQKKSEKVWILSESQFILLEIRRIPRARSH